jgi:hypothetical protein
MLIVIRKMVTGDMMKLWWVSKLTVNSESASKEEPNCGKSGDATKKS